MSAAGMQGGPPVAPDPAKTGGTVTALSDPTSPTNTGVLGTSQQIPAVNYVNAYGNGPDMSLVSDPGVARIIDPLGNQVQVPVVSNTIAVEKTSTGVLFAVGAIVFYLIFHKEF